MGDFVRQFSGTVLTKAEVKGERERLAAWQFDKMNKWCSNPQCDTAFEQQTRMRPCATDFPADSAQEGLRHQVRQTLARSRGSREMTPVRFTFSGSRGLHNFASAVTIASREKFCQ